MKLYSIYLILAEHLNLLNMHLHTILVLYQQKQLPKVRFLKTRQILDELRMYIYGYINNYMETQLIYLQGINLHPI